MNGRQALAVLALAAAVLSVSTAAGEPGAPRPGEISRDTRLQTHAECRVPGRSLAAFLREASAATGVALTPEGETGDQKVILLTRSSRAGQVLDLAANHFGFRWRALPGEAGSSRPAGYRLVQAADRRTLGRRLKEAAERARTERILGRLELRLRHLNSPPEVLARLRAQDPFISDLATDARLRARLGLAALLTPAQRRGVASGQPFVSPPLDRLPLPARELALRASGLSEFPQDLSRLRYTVRREGEDGGDQLMLWLLGPEGRPLGRSSALTFGQSPRREALVPVTRYATDPRRRPADRDLERVAELLDGEDRPLEITADLPALLEALSQATGLEILSDFYAGQTLRFQAEPLGRRPLWQLLNIVTQQYCLTWSRRGSFLLFRHQEWYEVEPEEVPERVLAAWRTERKPPERVRAGEYLGVVAGLSAEQMAALHYQFRGVRLRPPYTWEKFLDALTPPQRQALLDGEALRGRDLGRSAQARLAALLSRSGDEAPALPPGAQVRLRTAGESLEGAVESGAATLRFRSSLPFKQPLLPLVRVKLLP
jgi:hypothetical protein